MHVTVGVVIFLVLIIIYINSVMNTGKVSEPGV